MSAVTSVGDLAGLLLLLVAGIVSTAATTILRRPAAHRDETRPARPYHQSSDPADPALPAITGTRADPPAGSRKGRGTLVEDRVAGPAALQLEETVGPGDQQYAIPQPRSVVAARDR